MMAPHAGLERRVVAALEATPPRIPVVLGGCGTGRTTTLHALADRLGRDDCQYIDVERAASTPERFAAAVASASPFPVARAAESSPQSPREAFDHTLAHFTSAHASDRPATFLLDEVLELRTFESFPGLRHVLRELLQALQDSGNRFVLTSRYVTRAHRLLRDATARFEVIHLPALSSNEVSAMLPPMGEAAADDRQFLSRTIQALSDGRASYVRAISDATAPVNGRVGDPISCAHRAADLRWFAHHVVRLSLRAASSPRARLRRAEGDSGNPRRRGGADAHRDRAAPAPHAGIDQGLSLVARGRRSGRLSAEAIQLCRSAAAPVGSPPLPSGPTDRRRSGSRGAELRAGATAAGAGADARDGWRRGPANASAGGLWKSIELRGRGRGAVAAAESARPEAFSLRDLRDSQPAVPRRRSVCNAVFAASCSASFLVRPIPWAMTSPPTSTST